LRQGIDVEHLTWKRLNERDDLLIARNVPADNGDRSDAGKERDHRFDLYRVDVEIRS